MSKNLLFEALTQDTNNITSTEKFVLVCLANRCNESNTCFPSLETIAKDTGFSTRTAHRAVKALQEKGFIKARQRFMANGPKIQTSNEYTLTLSPTSIDTKSNKPYLYNSFPSHSVKPRKRIHKNLASLAG
jgi:DNA-binding transcriptional MocR family regulator